MPTFRHGKGTVIRFIHGGSTTKLSSSFDDSELKRQVDTAEVTAYTASDKAYIAGLRGGEFSLSGHYSRVEANIIAATLGSTALPVFHYGPDGSTATGRQKYIFSGVVKQFDIKSPVGDKVSCSGSAVISGAVTSTTWA